MIFSVQHVFAILFKKVVSFRFSWAFLFCSSMLRLLWFRFPPISYFINKTYIWSGVTIIAGKKKNGAKYIWSLSSFHSGLLMADFMSSLKRIGSGLGILKLLQFLSFDSHFPYIEALFFLVHLRQSLKVFSEHCAHFSVICLFPKHIVALCPFVCRAQFLSVSNSQGTSLWFYFFYVVSIRWDILFVGVYYSIFVGSKVLPFAYGLILWNSRCHRFS